MKFIFQIISMDMIYFSFIHGGIWELLRQLSLYYTLYLLPLPLDHPLLSNTDLIRFLPFIFNNRHSQLKDFMKTNRISSNYRILMLAIKNLT
jgi:hypothetical protein